MSEPPAPTDEELRRELEAVRAAQQPEPAPTQPPVRHFLMKGPLRRLVIWWLLGLAVFGLCTIIGKGVRH